MHPAGYESTTSAGERLQTHALDRSGTGTGNFFTVLLQIKTMLPYVTFTITLCKGEILTVISFSVVYVYGFIFSCFRNAKHDDGRLEQPKPIAFFN
jgi:hypothetical protein